MAVDPGRVSVVARRAGLAIDAVLFAVAACALAEGDADHQLSSEPSFIALAASLRSSASSLPPLRAAFVAANS